MAKLNSQSIGQPQQQQKVKPPQITDEFIEVKPGTSKKKSPSVIPDDLADIIQKQRQIDPDPKKLFELVSKNYENWSQAMFKQFEQDNANFSPFPDDSIPSANTPPIFDYSLLEALDVHDDNNEKVDPPKSDKKSVQPSPTLLSEYEIDFLRDRISQMIQHQGIGTRDKNSTDRGFSLYDTRDEEGLHAGNTDDCYDQDDYDLEEITGDDDFHHHHIEVELNTVPECDVHGMDGCDCPIYDYVEGEEDTQNGPSCEFTFEYDHTGKLIPTYNNVEEKLRLMNLENRLKQQKLPSISELNITTGSNTTKKKKNKKNKKKNQPAKSTTHQNLPTTIPQDYYGYIPSDKCCLFCEYQAIFGSKPRQMMKWYDQRILQEEQRRIEFKKKLENAKSKAIKKQRELRNKQLQQQQQKEEGQQLKQANREIEDKENHEVD
ncbi:hypothetical protein JA1_003085 [Spathaspora sp. JA1]|nr:hypothetical protein JA1_003085 [Spathaspora sp. JA1]